LQNLLNAREQRAKRAAEKLAAEAAANTDAA